MVQHRGVEDGMGSGGERSTGGGVPWPACAINKFRTVGLVEYKLVIWKEWLYWLSNRTSLSWWHAVLWLVVYGGGVWRAIEE